MTTRPRIVLASAAFLALLLPARAHADAQERALGVVGLGGHLSVDAFSSTAEAWVAGGGIRVGYDPRNWLGLDARAGYLYRRGLELPGAHSEGFGGEGFVVRTNTHVISAGVGARLYLENAPLLPFQLRPSLTLRPGIVVQRLTNAALYDFRGAIVSAPEDSTSFLPTFAVEGGLAYRWTDRIGLDLVAGVQLGARYQLTYLALEVSWFTYQLF